MAIRYHAGLGHGLCAQLGLAAVGVVPLFSSCWAKSKSSAPFYRLDDSLRTLVMGRPRGMIPTKTALQPDLVAQSGGFLSRLSRRSI